MAETYHGCGRFDLICATRHGRGMVGGGMSRISKLPFQAGGAV